MKIIDETFFVDTNVLVAATDRSRASHSATLNLFDRIPRSGGHLVWSGQVKREYLVVATRPCDKNGLGLTPTSALENINQFSCFLTLLEENTQVSHRLERLIATHQLKGKRIHDANIVATMTRARVFKLITGNATDYNPFDDIQVYQPADFD